MGKGHPFPVNNYFFLDTLLRAAGFALAFFDLALPAMLSFTRILAAASHAIGTRNGEQLT